MFIDANFASNRDPETTINEWRGTCSGKHYLLQKLQNQKQWFDNLKQQNYHQKPHFVIQKLMFDLQ